MTHLDQQPKVSAKRQLWGLGYYFAFTTNENLRQLARMLRAQRKLQRPFPLREFRGLSPAVVKQLAANGIIPIKQRLTAGNTAAKRAALATSTGVAELVILEIVKLADLARIPGVQGIRARLYHDADVDTLAKLAQWEPELWREMLVEFVTQTGFEGLAPIHLR